jgi:hypothetical protein
MKNVRTVARTPEASAEALLSTTRGVRDLVE